jgi:lipooligosaccharide transport system permease protein
MRSESGFSLIYRLGLMPMFLFSGAFFPISKLGGFAWLAYFTPIYHGVDLARSLTLGRVDVWPDIGHLAYISTWFVAGYVFTVTGFARRLSQ